MTGAIVGGGGGGGGGWACVIKTGPICAVVLTVEWGRCTPSLQSGVFVGKSRETPIKVPDVPLWMRLQFILNR